MSKFATLSLFTKTIALFIIKSVARERNHRSHHQPSEGRPSDPNIPFAEQSAYEKLMQVATGNAQPLFGPSQALDFHSGTFVPSEISVEQASGVSSAQVQRYMEDQRARRDAQIQNSTRQNQDPPPYTPPPSLKDVPPGTLRHPNRQRRHH